MLTVDEAKNKILETYVNDTPKLLREDDSVYYFLNGEIELAVNKNTGKVKELSIYDSMGIDIRKLAKY